MGTPLEGHICTIPLSSQTWADWNPTCPPALCGKHITLKKVVPHAAHQQMDRAPQTQLDSCVRPQSPSARLIRFEMFP